MESSKQGRQWYELYNSMPCRGVMNIQVVAGVCVLDRSSLSNEEGGFEGVIGPGGSSL